MLIIGNSASTITTILVISPMPNQMIRSGRIASLGMGRVISIIGSRMAWAVRFMPISKPVPTPTTTQNRNATPNRNRLMPRWCSRLPFFLVALGRDPHERPSDRGR